MTDTAPGFQGLCRSSVALPAPRPRAAPRHTMRHTPIVGSAMGSAPRAVALALVVLCAVLAATATAGYAMGASVASEESVGDADLVQSVRCARPPVFARGFVAPRTPQPPQPHFQ